MSPAGAITPPIEIIGGGLAGLSLGIALRREHVPVTIYEAGAYPRHRVCGEFITGLAQSTIDRLDLGAVLGDALVHRDVAWFLGNETDRVQIQRLPAPALGISRYELDARLARRFVEAGGELRAKTRVTELGNRPGRVFATGRRRAQVSRWIGLKLHARSLPTLRELELHLGEHCYVGLARVEGDAVNVCGLFRRRSLRNIGPALLLDYLRAGGLEKLAARITAAEIDAGSFCAVAALDFDGRLRPTDHVRIGDAGAMIAPFTGNGMAMAFQSAELALEPLLAYARGTADWAVTCRATHAAQRGCFRLRLASADALHPFLLQPRRQRWFAALSRARLLPFGPLYASLH